MRKRMTVSDLIEELKNYDEDMEVGFTYNYGDYWRTAVVEGVESVEELAVERSDYHNMDKLAKEEEEESSEENKTIKKMIILS